MPRKVVPVAVERGRERNHAAAADAPLRPSPPRHRRTARARGRSGAGVSAAVPEEPHVGEVAVPRILELLEDRMAVVEAAERAAAGVRCDRPARRACPAAAATSPLDGRALAEHDEQAAALLDEPRQQVGRLPSTARRVVQDDDATGRRSSPAVTRDGRHDVDLERRRLARSSAVVRNRLDRPAAPSAWITSTDTGRLGESTK